MSIEKTKEELIEHKEQALHKLEAYLDNLISAEDSKENSKSDKISYWIEDWVNFLSFEPDFSPSSLRRYKRGEIVKVHLGFNVGSEEGGLHYAVVLDKKNAKKSPILTVLPLTSVKEGTDINNLGQGRIFLGNELFTSLQTKVSTTQKHLVNDLNILLSSESQDTYTIKIESIKAGLVLLERIKREIMKMKRGSIGLTNQITTVSKMRIYDPKTDHDILSNIKLSNEKLDLIDNEILKLYTNYKPK